MAVAAPVAGPVSKLERCARVVAIIQGVATTIALMAGAVWFLQQRETYPHGQLEQSIDAVPVHPGLIAVEVQIRFENIGKKLIKLKAARIKLQNVSSQPYDYVFLSSLRGVAYWRATRFGSSESPHFNQGELRWPVLKQFDGPIDYTIEPGETDLMVFTFLISCHGGPDDSYVNLHRIRVASDVIKPGTNDRNELAWKARGITDVSKVCSEKGDSK